MKTILLILFIVNLIHGLGTWKLYTKAGYKSWQSFIPIYSIFILMKIINRSRWWIILLTLPVINVIMIPVVWVELSRSFGKNSYLDTVLSIVTLGFYNYYLNYFTKVKYVENRDLNPKSSNGEWTSSLIFAIVAATIIHTYFIQPYTIPTSSLEKTLLVGDFLFVSKINYGARVPMTTIAAPMVHDSLPFTKGFFGKDIYGKPIKAKSYLNKEQIPFISELPYLRFPGFEKIRNNDIVVFNWPVDTLFNMIKRTDKNYYKPIDKKTNYVKRAVGIAGDTLEVINGYVYINGEKNILPDEAKLQFSYLVQPKRNRFSKRVMINNYDITDAFGIIDQNNTYKFMGISDNALNKFKFHPNVEWIVKDTLPKGYRDSSVFPQSENYEWNNDFFGPIYIPKKGETIEINSSNINLYKRLIDVYENNNLLIKGDKIYVNNKEISEYTFKQDYYWLMGDNRGNSQDSRSWGFVPFDHVVGKPVFKWFSWDSNAKGLSKIRWNRLFTSISGTGGPINLFFGFVTILIIFWLLSIDYSNFKKGWNKSKN